MFSTTPPIAQHHTNSSAWCQHQQPLPSKHAWPLCLLLVCSCHSTSFRMLTHCHHQWQQSSCGRITPTAWRVMRTKKYLAAVNNIITTSKCTWHDASMHTLHNPHSDPRHQPVPYIYSYYPYPSIYDTKYGHIVATPPGLCFTNTTIFVLDCTT